MSDGLNKVMLIGNLTADPELRFTQGGSAVLNVRLATNESYLDSNKVRQERVDYHSVVIWGKRGEALAKIMAKGGKVFIEGGIRTSSYDDKEGKRRYKTEIHASNVLLLGGKSPGGGGSASDGERSERGFGNGRRDSPAGDDLPLEDDIPF